MTSNTTNLGASTPLRECGKSLHIPLANLSRPQAPELARVVVVGSSGVGKSWLAGALAERLGCPFVELDELFWGTNWTPRPGAEFLSLVRAAAAGEHWVAAGNYSSARGELWSRATAVVWLNFSLAYALRRVLPRTARRIWRRESLWHGNRESLLRTLFTRQSIVWWLLTTHNERRRNFGALRRGKEFSHLRWFEFSQPAQAERFLAEVG